LSNSLTRYRELEHHLGDPIVIGDRVRYTKIAKEHVRWPSLSNLISNTRK